MFNYYAILQCGNPSTYFGNLFSVVKRGNLVDSENCLSSICERVSKQRRKLFIPTQILYLILSIFFFKISVDENSGFTCLQTHCVCRERVDMQIVRPTPVNMTKQLCR